MSSDKIFLNIFFSGCVVFHNYLTYLTSPFLWVLFQYFAVKNIDEMNNFICTSCCATQVNTRGWATETSNTKRFVLYRLGYSERAPFPTIWLCTWGKGAKALVLWWTWPPGVSAFTRKMEALDWLGCRISIHPGSCHSHCALSSLFPGDLSLDFPMPGMPSGPVTRWFPLSRAAQMYQLFCQGVWLYAPTVHSIQGGLCALQDPPAPRQDQVLQVHLGALQVLGRGWAELGRWLLRFLDIEGPQGHPLGGWPKPFMGRGSGKNGKEIAFFLLKSATLGLEPWSEDTGVPYTGHW